MFQSAHIRSYGPAHGKQQCLHALSCAMISIEVRRTSQLGNPQAWRKIEVLEPLTDRLQKVRRTLKSEHERNNPGRGR